MATPHRSYADALRPAVLPPDDPHEGELPSLEEDVDPNHLPIRANSITIVEPGTFASTAASRSVSISAGSMSSSPNPPPRIRRPSGPRRQSIAQVLGLSKTPSRTSYVSEGPSGPDFSASDYHLEPPMKLKQRETGKAKSKKNKRTRPRNKRRKSSTTRDHGDFIAAHGQGIEWRPTQMDGTTPLLRAITEGDVETVRSLITSPTYTGPRGPDSRALQAAALSGDPVVVSLLLETGKFDINARDARERTALYAATSRGQEAVSKLLLNKGAKQLSQEESRIAKQELKRWKDYEAQIELREEAPSQNGQAVEDADLTAEPDSHDGRNLGNASLRTHSRGESEDGDHIYKLVFSSAENFKEMEEAANEKRRILQRRGKWVAGPILSPQPLPDSSKDRKAQQKHVRYSGFGFELPIVEIDFDIKGGHRIVSPTPSVEQVLYGSENIPALDGPTTETTCRWYHIPANHLGWAEDLIRKIYEDRPASEQKKRDVILAREPFYSGDYDYTNTTLLDPRPQARSLRPLCRNMTLDREGNLKLSSALTMHIPFIHWETEENRAAMAHVMEEVRQGRKDDIDNGDSPLRSIPEMKTIAANNQWSKNEKMLCAYLYNKPPVHPRRTLDQFYYHMLEDTEERDQDQVIGRYYHNVWKRNHHVPEDEDEAQFATSPNKSKFKFKLSRPYNVADVTTDIQSPKHLDRGFRHPTDPIDKHLDTPPDSAEFKQEEKHVLMVDQLWLWILDDKTIISCFPQNWTHDKDAQKNEKDPLDVLQSIFKYLTLINRPPLESVHDLAQLIVYKCLATFCKKSTPYGPMQILDVYESAIASVTDRESKIFAKFADKSKESRLKKDDTTEARERESPEDLYNIDEEIEQLKEIKDIQDELHILSVLLENQSLVLDQAATAIKSTTDVSETGLKSPVNLIHVNSSQSEAGEVAPYSSENHFRKLHNMILEQDKRRKALEGQAETANKALNHLLDLKQKQANVSEARSARWTAESTKQQGNIMVLFTLVTIIFAPLSLMATIFSLNLVEFPEHLHQSYVFKYMFGISLAIIAPLFGLVIYSTRFTIAHVFMGLEYRIIHPRWLDWKTKEENWKKSKQDQDGDAMSSTVEGSGSEKEVRPLKRRGGFWRKKEVEVAEDAERGVVEKVGGRDSRGSTP